MAQGRAALEMKSMFQQVTGYQRWSAVPYRIPLPEACFLPDINAVCAACHWCLLQLRKELSDGCADAVQQAQRIAAAMQSDLVTRLQAQDSSTQQALSKQQAAQDALKQQLQDQAAALTQQLSQQQQAGQEALSQHQKQQSAALAQTAADLQKEVDGKLSELELLLTGKVKEGSAGKAALTDTKLAELRCGILHHGVHYGVCGTAGPPAADALSSAGASTGMCSSHVSNA